MKTLQLPFGKFEFYPELIIGKLKAGIHYDLEMNEQLVQQVTDFYGYDLPISYIGLRENDYSIDPMVHKHNSQFENLCSVAIVDQKKNSLNSLELESKFFKTGKLQAFENVEEALVWSNREVTSQLANMEIAFSLN
ncbi:MAG: hypothetical protein ACSHWW_09690 [Nonlabens sp.]|uniref:hypothetical protein n=1 Tax=Nonlabens sp. TaxID=1888209 RepID=UPI003EF7BFD7